MSTMDYSDKSEIRDLAWRCPSCDNTLGYTDAQRLVLRMKYKDFYVFIEEAKCIVTLCRRCGRQCILQSIIPDEPSS